jgi:hypothetical protein
MKPVQNAKSRNRLDPSIVTSATDVYLCTITIAPGSTIAYSILVTQIGTRNHAIFLVFIFSVLAAMIGEIILSILVVFTGHVKEELLLPYHV